MTLWVTFNEIFDTCACNSLTVRKYFDGIAVCMVKIQETLLQSLSYSFCDPNCFQYLFQQLGVIVAIVKHHIRNYLDDIFELLKVWTWVVLTVEQF